MKKYLIERTNDKLSSNKFNAGSKARTDILNILEKNGFENIILELKDNGVEKLFSNLKLNSKLKNIKEKSIVIIQFPLAGTFLSNKILKILKEKNCKIISIIHDIDSLRFSELSNKIYKDIEILNKFDVVICHNEKMKNWIRLNGGNSKIVCLELFDYIMQMDNIKIKKVSSDLVFAGNLDENKSGFVYKLNNISINLYGDNFSENKQNNNINYKGKFEPEILPNVLNGNYGLIWDGKSVESCEGDSGEYLKFNNPHKLSLYIASGLPVITWRKAAISDFIEKNKIGILVDNLNDIKSAIEFNKKNYEEFLQNIEKIRNKVINGECTMESIKKSIELLREL